MPTEEPKGADREQADSQSANRKGEQLPAPGRDHSEPDRPAPGPPAPRHPWRRRIIIGVVGVSLVGVGLYYGIPWLASYWNHVSTTDAYVSGYVTYLAPRVASRVEKVAVHEDQFVTAGEVLITLDPQPFQLAVEQAKANLQLAEANLGQALAGVRAQISTVRGNQYLTREASDQVRLQVASLHAAAAELKLDQAQLVLAERNFDRTKGLLPTGAASQQDYDRNLAALQAARDKVASQVESVQQVRAGLGLPRNTQNPTEVPADIERRNPRVQSALSTWATSLLQMGVPLSLHSLDGAGLLTELDKWVKTQSSPQALDAVVERAPSVQVGHANLAQARAALDTAQLNLSYTQIKAPFDGFVTKRTVNPGDYATVGQNLLAVQSLHDVWVYANFKETAIKELRIGMPVSIYVDAYPGKVFSGRVAGFSPATGAQLSLLPPENATGNFVKVVQRLPVRIEFDQPPPRETPLFVGLSVEPEVQFKAPPQGPYAGQRLRLPTAQAWPPAVSSPDGRRLAKGGTP